MFGIHKTTCERYAQCVDSIAGISIQPIKAESRSLRRVSCALSPSYILIASSVFFDISNKAAAGPEQVLAEP